MEETKVKKKNFYPTFKIAPNKNPNRFYAFPFFGFLFKLIILFPVFIEAIFLAIISPFILMLTWFVISFTGNYWNFGYTFFLGLFRFSTKIGVFLYGITDKYPGFSLATDGIFTLDIAKPTNPNRWLAVPIVGFVIRLVLLIPYHIFSQVMQNGAGIAMMLSWFTILFQKSFPESFYEFEHDSLRVGIAANAYLVGMSDSYPNFSISMNHQTAKILLIIAGALLVAANWGDSMMTEERRDRSSDYQYEYNNSDYYTPPVDDSGSY